MSQKPLREFTINGEFFSVSLTKFSHFYFYVNVELILNKSSDSSRGGEKNGRVKYFQYLLWYIDTAEDYTSQKHQ